MCLDGGKVSLPSTVRAEIEFLYFFGGRLDRSQKENLVTQLQDSLKKAKTVIVAHQEGLTVAESTDLRNKMRESDAAYKVIKNRLALRALKGTKFEVLGKLFLGPTAIAFSEDMIAPAKIAFAFAKENPKLTIVGGCHDGNELTLEEIQNLANLPSLDELRGKIIGILSSPARNIACILQSPAIQIANVFRAYSENE